MSSSPRDSSSVPVVAEEQEQLHLDSTPDVTAKIEEPFPQTKQQEEEEAEFSDHSDSWEVISRASPKTPPTTETEEEPAATEEHQVVSTPQDGFEQEQEQLGLQDTRPTAASAPDALSEEEEEFAYTSTPEEIHSDADTYRTDDLFRHGELDVDAEPFNFSESPRPAAENALEGEAEGTASSSPQKSLSCTPTEDDDFINLAAAMMHKHQQMTTNDEEQFDNAEALALQKFIVEPATATAAALVGAAQAVITTTGQFVVSFTDRLRAFAAKFRAYVTTLQPAAHRLGGTMSSTVNQMARSLQFKAGPGVKALYIPLNGAGVLASDVVKAVRHVMCTAATRARKAPKTDFSFFKDLDWVKVGLAVATVGCAGMLWKVNAANSRLTYRLAQREGELAELVARIVALQRNITSHRVPLIRHTNGATTFSTTVGWPLLVQTI